MEHFYHDFYADSDFVSADIYPVQYGEEQCTPDHDFGPSIRNNYIIHYVYRGTGVLRLHDTAYTLQAGQLFLIPPNYVTYYKADSENPWLYRWIEFNGNIVNELLSRAGLSLTSPILSDSSDSENSPVGPIGMSLLRIIEAGKLPYPQLMEYFWHFIAALTEHAPQKVYENISETYVRQAELFIKNNLHKSLSVNAVADYIGIDRSYLCRLFNEYLQVSPKQYIDTHKMNMAAQYLNHSDLSVTEIALSLGYSDCHAFNKAFKNMYKCAPSVWRRKPTYDQIIQDAPI